MKGKVEKMRNITADLPEGLNSPQSVRLCLCHLQINFRKKVFNSKYTVYRNP